ncbi:unnamed protein product [Pedinophyceae sp. YPF-701]|nr:unnamed protein product [Pedinophyceae sp. YPF-701]
MDAEVQLASFEGEETGASELVEEIRRSSSAAEGASRLRQLVAFNRDTARSVIRAGGIEVAAEVLSRNDQDIATRNAMAEVLLHVVADAAAPEYLVTRPELLAQLTSAVTAQLTRATAALAVATADDDDASSTEEFSSAIERIISHESLSDMAVQPGMTPAEQIDREAKLAHALQLTLCYLTQQIPDVARVAAQPGLLEALVQSCRPENPHLDTTVATLTALLLPDAFAGAEETGRLPAFLGDEELPVEGPLAPPVQHARSSSTARASEAAAPQEDLVQRAIELGLAERLVDVLRTLARPGLQYNRHDNTFARDSNAFGHMDSSGRNPATWKETVCSIPFSRYKEVSVGDSAQVEMELSARLLSALAADPRARSRVRSSQALRAMVDATLACNGSENLALATLLSAKALATDAATAQQAVECGAAALCLNALQPPYHDRQYKVHRFSMCVQLLAAEVLQQLSLRVPDQAALILLPEFFPAVMSLLSLGERNGRRLPVSNFVTFDNLAPRRRWTSAWRFGQMRFELPPRDAGAPEILRSLCSPPMPEAPGGVRDLVVRMQVLVLGTIEALAGRNEAVARRVADSPIMPQVLSYLQVIASDNVPTLLPAQAAACRTVRAVAKWRAAQSFAAASGAIPACLRIVRDQVGMGAAGACAETLAELTQNWASLRRQVARGEPMVLLAELLRSGTPHDRLAALTAMEAMAKHMDMLPDLDASGAFPVLLDVLRTGARTQVTSLPLQFADEEDVGGEFAREVPEGLEGVEWDWVTLHWAKIKAANIVARLAEDPRVRQKVARAGVIRDLVLLLTIEQVPATEGEERTAARRKVELEVRAAAAACLTALTRNNRGTRRLLATELALASWCGRQGSTRVLGLTNP